MTWRAISARPELSALFDALGDEVVKMAHAGNREAEYSLGAMMVSSTAVAGSLSAAGTSPQADVGFARLPDLVPSL
jgi:hypothetical protein